ncbi:ABC transporter ATP-binding protein [Jannaschia seohaensis]|uniref:ATP-binding cassette subfamily B protein n=1 Tax=Jannaschia seohaensis TaxID=475081 RepID=A0A2Y9AZS8_9RHOB|nr:ABC transporter ATP-binding protein [Jannaschia seohaensis]PWJ16491.1 ATP-binding cassette subfamily B protein [Jannaschia seohaensis]SSA48728.1 ATP-binding cassette, subfamily B/ATP-binding cassette, subfamily B, MsbA [Jannaschia seohaensis]
MTRPRHPFARLWRGYLKRHWPWILVAALLMAIEGSSVGALAYMLEPMFDVVFVDGRSDLIVVVGLAIFALFAVRGVVSVLHRIIMTRVSFDASARLQQDLLGHVLRLDNAYFSANSPGQLIERVQGDVQAIQLMWTGILTSAGRDAMGLVSLMAVALMVDPLWTLIAVVGAPLLVLPSLVVQRYIRKKSHALREIAGRRTTRLDEIFHGISPIKLNAMEAYQEGRFRAATAAMVRATVRAKAGQATVPALVDISVGAGFFAVLMYGGPQIIAGEKTIGEFMSFFTAMSLAFQPLRRLADLSGNWQTMMASLERIYALRDTVPTILEQPDAAARPPADVSIVFEDVALSYGDNPVLRGVSFEVLQGTTTALVGLSGAGKSTLFNVLTRLVDPDEGRVTIGGEDIRTRKLSELRALFSVVSQDTLLFDETLRENLTLGRDVPEARLQAALEAAHVVDFFDDLPAGLDSPAGPRGANLSGGQRQRVAIARALLRDTPILLLDEATSALDTKSERLVQQALARLSHNRTTLVIAHRLSTVQDADQIVVLDQGRVAQRGTHAELLAEGGLYAQLHGMQVRE